MEIGRLRRRLGQYYATEGANDAIKIGIPMGAYAATFKTTRINADAVAEAEPTELRDWNRNSRLTATAVLLAIAAVAIFIVKLVSTDLWSSDQLQQNEAAVSIPRIAVLQFLNASPNDDTSEEYLAYGFTTELVVAMTRYRHMAIVSRAASSSHGNVGVDLREIGKDLSARYIIRGSVRNDGTLLRVTAELIDTQTADVVWGKTYTKSLTSAEAYETAANIAEQVANAVAKPHGVVYRNAIPEVPVNSTNSLSSYQCILKAYDYERKRGADYHKVVRVCLENTVEREPEFVVAWILLSAVYLDEHRNGYNRKSGSLERATAAAMRAIQLAPKDPQSHWAMALVHYFNKDFSDFFDSAENALKLGANDADMLANLGFKLVVSGINRKRGIELMEKAMEMSPAHPPLWHFPHALFHYYRRAYDDALLVVNKFNIPKLYMFHMVRAMILGQLGRTELAQAAAAETVKLKPNFAKEFWADMQRRNMPDPAIGHMAEGLRKSGLHIPSAD